VSGLTPLTTIDYPGELAAVVFLQGCPWSCGYCQNSGLIPSTKDSILSWENDIISFLEQRKGLLDAVVFSGGEPTLQKGLMDAMKQVRAMGYKVGLHSAGIYPDRLKKLLPFIDWVGLDIKAAKENYPTITNTAGSGERAWESAQIVINSGVDHEFRVTVHPDLLNLDQVSQLEKELLQLGATQYMFQPCVTQRCLDKKLQTNISLTHSKGKEKILDRYCQFL